MQFSQFTYLTDWLVLFLQDNDLNPYKHDVTNDIGGHYTL